MRATPPARALAASVDFLDRFWGLLVVAVVAALEALVFGPRGMTEWMIAGGCVAAGAFIVWLWGLGN